MLGLRIRFSILAKNMGLCMHGKGVRHPSEYGQELVHNPGVVHGHLHDLGYENGPGKAMFRELAQAVDSGQGQVHDNLCARDHRLVLD